MAIAPGQSQPVEPEKVEVDRGSLSPELYLKESYTPLLSEGMDSMLGGVKIKTLVRKNPDIVFASWLENYQNKNTHDEIKKVLSEHDICKNPSNIDRFVNELSNKGPAYRELQALVEKAEDYRSKYETVAIEAEEFKEDVVVDSLKNFWDHTIVENLQNKPIATIAGIGATLLIIHQAWTKLFNDTVKKGIGWTAFTVATIYILNDIVPSFHLKEGDPTLTELIGLRKPKIDSPEMKWFFKETGIAISNSKVDLMMKLSTVSIGNIVDEYIQARDGGSHEIAIGDLLNDPSLSADEVRELESMDNTSLRRSLYKTVDKMVKLSGLPTATALKNVFSGQTLLSVIMQLYEKISGETGETDMALIEQGVERTYSENDRSINAILDAKSVPDGIEIKAHDDKIWVNGYPFNYEKTDEAIVLESLSGVKFGWSEVPLAEGADLNSFFTESVAYAKLQVEELFKGKTGEDFENKITWDGDLHKSVGYPVPEISELGIESGQTIDLYGEFLPPDWSFELKVEKDATMINTENFEDLRIKACLRKKLQEKGPLCCQKGKTITIESYDKGTSEIKASIDDSKMTLEYEGDRYLLKNIEWNEFTLGVYKEDLKGKADKMVEDKFDFLMDPSTEQVISAVLQPINKHEFKKLREDKGIMISQMLAGKIAVLGEQDDLDKVIFGYRDNLLEKLEQDLDGMARNLQSDGETPQFDLIKLAGVPQGDYRDYVGKLSDLLETYDYKGSDTLGNTRYEARNMIFDLFFEKTGRFYDKGFEMADDEKSYCEFVIFKINQGLNNALNAGTSPDKKIKKDEVGKMLDNLRTREALPDYNEWDSTTEFESVSVETESAEDPILTLKITPETDRGQYIEAAFEILKKLDNNSTAWKVLVDMKKSASSNRNLGTLKTEVEAILALSEPAERFPALFFLGVGNEMPDINPDLDAKMAELVEQLRECNDPLTEAIRIKADINKIALDPAYSGKQEAYKYYLEGVFMKASRLEDEGKIKELFEKVKPYTDSGWWLSDEGLTARRVELQEQNEGLHDSRTPYDLTDFMNERYQTTIDTLSSEKMPAAVELKVLEMEMGREFKFLEIKKEFWKKINELNLKKDLEKIGEQEKRLHSFFMELDVLSFGQKTYYYGSILNTYYFEQIRDGNIPDRGDFRKKIKKTFKDADIGLDKGALDVV
ncbi:MAG: hypothetical protein ABII07_02575 [Patescibacteria group bacterium]